MRLRGQGLAPEARVFQRMDWRPLCSKERGLWEGKQTSYTLTRLKPFPRRGFFGIVNLVKVIFGFI